MKPQEAIGIMKIALAEVEWEYPMDYATAFETAIEALEKVEKYKWHDLKKNPDDLPVLKIGNECVEVLVKDVAEPFTLQYDDAIMKFGEWCDIYDSYTLGYLDSEFKEWDTSVYEEIIAWRYIEEFEGQEE